VPLFDTHAHLVSDQLKDLTNEVLASAKEAGLVGMTSIGTDLASSQSCVALAEKHDQIYAAVGVHPNDCHHASDSDWNAICQLAQKSRVVAIGETGLDRYWDTVPIELQREWFRRHIDLSFETEKPLVIHMRDCDQDVVDMLNQHQRDGQIIGILHSFAGQWETAQRALELGMYISFAGMVTFKKSAELREIAKQIPDDRILVETDAPYLSPHPHRGVRPNQPALVQHTAACLATERGMAIDQFGELVTANAKRIFRLSPDL
jgi:TatD DNase family protein